MTGSTLWMDSPVGRLRLSSDGHMLTAVHFQRFLDEGQSDTSPDEVVVETREQLNAYFAGRLRAFDVPVALQGSEFQRRVWSELRTITFGATVSYADIAVRLDMPVSASRAVGLANGMNPVAIIVPCHRVIGSDGSLVGYAGGLHRKRFLLGLESPTVQDALFSADLED